MHGRIIGFIVVLSTVGLGCRTASAQAVHLTPQQKAAVQRLALGDPVRIVRVICADGGSPYPLDGGAVNAVVYLNADNPSDKGWWSWYLFKPNQNRDEYLIVSVNGAPNNLALDGRGFAYFDPTHRDGWVRGNPNVNINDPYLRWNLINYPDGSVQLLNVGHPMVVDGGATDRNAYMQPNPNLTVAFQRWKLVDVH